MDRLAEFEVLLVTKRQEWICVRIARRTRDLAKLARHIDRFVGRSLPRDPHPQRVRELVRDSALAAVHFAPVAAGRVAGIASGRLHALEHASGTSLELRQ